MKCERCGKDYEEYADVEPRICPECLWRSSESRVSQSSTTPSIKEFHTVVTPFSFQVGRGRENPSEEVAK